MKQFVISTIIYKRLCELAIIYKMALVMKMFPMLLSNSLFGLINPGLSYMGLAQNMPTILFNKKVFRDAAKRRRRLLKKVLRKTRKKLEGLRNSFK